MDLKTALSSDKDEAVLEEAIRGEKTALEEYNEIIKNGELPLSTTNIIAKQRDSVQNALVDAKGLETLA